MKPLSREHTQLSCHRLAEKGIEVTPDELETIRKETYAVLREEMAKLGHVLPEDDAELFLLLRRLKARGLLKNLDDGET